MIPYGYSVTMYDSDDFTGEAFTIDGPKYQDSDLLMPCISLAYDFDNRMESVVVSRTGHPEMPEPTPRKPASEELSPIIPKVQTPPEPNLKYPGDNCCTFYSETDYNG